MITSIYKGGLGNSMFQVACGLSLAIDSHDEYCINRKLHQGLGQGKPIKCYLDNVFSKVKKERITPKNLYKEKIGVYCKIPYTQDLLLDGYFQSEKYFENNGEVIKGLFTLPYIEIPTGDKKKVVIQIRTGDYFAGNNENFRVVNENYFKTAVNKILSENRKEDLVFFIATDNYGIAYEKYLRYLDISYKFLNEVGFSDEISEMGIMANSDYCIISNSSFGWWGSYMGKKKTTYVPYKWFADGSNEDIFRKDMIKVEF